MTPDEERACYERAAVTVWNALMDYCRQTHIHPSENNQLFRIVQEVRALPLTTESAAPQDTKPQVEKCKASVPPAPAADPYGTDSEGWSKNPNHWANKESALAQFSTATVQCISGGDTLTEREVPIVGQGDIAQGAAPLEPVAEIAYAGLGDIRRLQFVAVKETLPDKTKLYAIPPGYAVVPTEPTEKMAKAGLRAIDPTRCEREDAKLCYRAMLAAGSIK